MIDLTYAEKNFDEYTKKYDMTNIRIKRKYNHSYRVEKLSTSIAESLNLSSDKIKLATLIGLLHDIGRFEQLKQFNTFRDSESFDHGDFGANYLKDNLRDFIETDIYDSIITTAVKNHNKFQIDEKVKDDELLFSKIIRDADKIDILYETTCIFWENEENIINNSVISDYAYNSIKNLELIKYTKDNRLEKLDGIIKGLAFIFDINYKKSFEILKETDYINKIINRFNYKDFKTKERMREIQILLNDYIDSKI